MIAEAVLFLVCAAVVYMFILQMANTQAIAYCNVEIARMSRYQISNEQQLQNLVNDLNGNLARLQARIDSVWGV